MYNIETDEWQFIASLTITRWKGNMLLIDETLYVLVGLYYREMQNPEAPEWTIECYDPGKNE